MQKRHPWLPWLLGVVGVAALLLLTRRISDFRFENSDDALILKSFLGFEGGKPANFSLYLHTLAGWGLYALSLLTPGVPWFSLLQAGLLALSGAVILKGMIQLAAGFRRPWLAGGLVGALYLCVFFVFAACRINYTTTAALAGSAAVVQYLTASRPKATRGQAARGYCLCALMLAAAYCLRAQSALPAAAFLALAFVWRLFGRRAEAQPRTARLSTLLGWTAALLVMLLALAGVRAAEISLRKLQPELDWHAARTALMDYTDFEADPAPALAADSGLSASEVELVRQWFFMDAAVTSDALNAMAGAYANEPQPGALSSLTDFFAQNPRQLYALILLMLLCGICWLGERQTSPGAALAATFATLGAAALLLILGLRGRLPARAVDTALMPALATVCGLLLLKRAPLGPGGRWRRAAAVALAALTLGAFALEARETLYAITRAPDTVSMQREDDLEQYALANPDTLVVRGSNLLRDTRLAPDVSAGIPGNIILWGDWTCHTPSWDAQLRSFGLDPEALSAADWLKETLVFAAAEPKDTDALRAWLSDALGHPVVAETIARQGTLSFYRFRASS